MTTPEAMAYLGKSKAFIYGLGKKGKIRRRLLPSGDNDWHDEDLQRCRQMMDYGVHPDSWEWGRQYRVAYCRVEPTGNSDLDPAAHRLADQKERVTRFCTGRGLEPDLILSEVRPALRYGVLPRDNNRPDEVPNAMQVLLGLISAGKIKELVIESIDRIGVASSWFLIEAICRCMGTEIVVMNTVWPTTEQRKESLLWMADLLAMHKALAGEINNQSLLDMYVKGFDPKATALATMRVESAILRREKEKKQPNWAKVPAEKRVLDLDDCWE